MSVAVSNPFQVYQNMSTSSSPSSANRRTSDRSHKGSRSSSKTAVGGPQQQVNSPSKRSQNNGNKNSKVYGREKFSGPVSTGDPALDKIANAAWEASQQLVLSSKSSTPRESRSRGHTPPQQVQYSEDASPSGKSKKHSSLPSHSKYLAEFKTNKPASPRKGDRSDTYADSGREGIQLIGNKSAEPRDTSTPISKASHVRNQRIAMSDSIAENIEYLTHAQAQHAQAVNQAKAAVASNRRKSVSDMNFRISKPPECNYAGATFQNAPAASTLPIPIRANRVKS